MGISFGIVIGKEVFGGVGFNVLNPALTLARLSSSRTPRTSLARKPPRTRCVVCGWAVDAWAETVAAADLVSKGSVDGYTGATPLLAVSSPSEAQIEAGMNAVQILNENGWGFWEMFAGFIPGSMGETSALAA